MRGARHTRQSKHSIPVPYPPGLPAFGRVMKNTVVPSTLVCSIVPDIASINVLATESPRPRLPRTVTEAGWLAKALNGFGADSGPRPGPASQTANR